MVTVCGLVSAVVGDGGGPTGHFADVVAAGAQPAAVGQGAGSAVGVAVHVVEVADRRVAVGVAAGAVPQPDQGAQGAVEAAPEPIGSDDRPPAGAVNSRRHHRRPRLERRRSWAVPAWIGPYPAISAGVGLWGSSRLVSGMSRCSSMFTSAAAAWPVTRSTRVSAMI